MLNLHTTLSLGVGTTKLRLVEAVDALPTVIFMVAAFANATPSRAIPEWPEPLLLRKTGHLFRLYCLWIRQAWAVWLWWRPNICSKRKKSSRHNLSQAKKIFIAFCYAKPICLETQRKHLGRAGDTLPSLEIPVNIFFLIENYCIFIIWMFIICENGMCEMSVP